MRAPLEALQKYFGYTTFKEPQEEIIASVLSGNDTFAILPTGSGKSLCYQIPGLLNDGVCLVISPLIALMQDQVEALTQRGIKAIALNSTQNIDDTIILFDNLLYGNYKFLYLSPEKLQSELIQQKISQLNLNLIAIDEAHCISEWGHDFRPSYLKIKIVRELHPTTPIIALTATATKTVTKDVIKQLDLSKYKLFKHSIVRKNIAIKIEHHEDVYKHLLALFKTTLKPTIIYVNSRKKTKDISFFLNKKKLKSSYYHGGLLANEKQLAYANWKSEKTPIMVATNAFGMGIDKNNVAHIIHLDIPTSIENYSQEAGRAGRNGASSFSTIFANKHTLSQLKNLTKKSILTTDFIKKIYQALNSYYQISYGELPQHYFSFNLTTFCTQYKTNTLQTYQALQLLEREGILVFDTYQNRQSTLKFSVTPAKVLAYSNSTNSELIRTILRNYGGLFDHNIKINETVLAKKLKTTPIAIKNQLLKISADGIANYKYTKNTNRLLFIQPREDAITIHRIARYIVKQNELKLSKMNAIIQFVMTTSTCRTKIVANYFGEKDVENCGICDICTTTHHHVSQKDRQQLSILILQLLTTKNKLSTQEIISNLNSESEIIIPILQILLDDDKIILTSQNKLQLKS